MLLTTTDVLQGVEIEGYLGIVTAEVVYGSNALRDFFAGIRDIIGGRTGPTSGFSSKAKKKPWKSWSGGPNAWGQTASLVLPSTRHHQHRPNRGAAAHHRHRHRR
jgi:hypothetical protein